MSRIALSSTKLSKSKYYIKIDKLQAWFLTVGNKWEIIVVRVIIKLSIFNEYRIKNLESLIIQ